MWTAILLQVILGQAQAAKIPTRIEVYHMPGQTVRVGRLTNKLRKQGTRIQYFLVNTQIKWATTLPVDTDALRRQAQNDPNLAHEALSILGRMRASSLGLTHMPAVVIDGKWVIYGNLDIDKCIRIWRSKR